MLRLTTRRLLYRTIATIWVSYHDLCVFLFLSLSRFLPHPPSLTSPSLSCLYLSIFRSRSCLFHASLRLSSVRFLCRHRHPPRPPSLARTRSPLVPISIFLSLVSSVFIFLLLVYAAHRTIAVSLAPPSNRRRAPADFAFKFGKFAGVGKWAAGMVSNTRARARPPIHYV